MITSLIRFLVRIAFLLSGTYGFYQLTFDFGNLAYQDSKSGLVSLSKWNRSLHQERPRLKRAR